MTATLPQEPGIYPIHNKVTGQRFTLSIPEAYSVKSVPLILILHWGGQVTPYYGKSILEGLALPALDELGAIMVAPDCMQAGWNNPESENDLLTLLSLLGEHYNLELGKTLVIGYSMGALGVWYLAARHQDTIAAGIAMAGPAPTEHIQTPWRIPMYVIHSRQDEYFSYDITAPAVEQLKEMGAPIEFVTIRSVTHFDTAGFIQPLRETIPWLRETCRTRS